MQSSECIFQLKDSTRPCFLTVNGEMIVDLPEMNPIYAKISELDWPIFLHGAGTATNPPSNGWRTAAQE